MNNNEELREAVEWEKVKAFIEEGEQEYNWSMEEHTSLQRKIDTLETELYNYVSKVEELENIIAGLNSKIYDLELKQ